LSRSLSWIIFLRFKSNLFRPLQIFPISPIPHKVVAQITIICFLFSLCLSCASAPPTRIYVKRDQLSKYNAVALTVSSSELDVRYSRERRVFFLGELEYLMRSLADSETTGHVKEALHENQFERMLGKYFLEQFTKSNLFKKMNYSAHDTNHKALVGEGYPSVSM
jgi:hypothetical protein